MLSLPCSLCVTPACLCLFMPIRYGHHLVSSFIANQYIDLVSHELNVLLGTSADTSSLSLSSSYYNVSLHVGMGWQLGIMLAALMPLMPLANVHTCVYYTKTGYITQLLKQIRQGKHGRCIDHYSLLFPSYTRGLLPRYFRSSSTSQPCSRGTGGITVWENSFLQG